MLAGRINEMNSATFEKHKVIKPPSVYIIDADGTVKFQNSPLAAVE
jgi:hypothetical protein